jgi:Tol biopolymer transport system component
MPGEAFDNNQDLNFPAYSPDGSTIYYNRYTPEHQTIEAWSMRADGSGQHRFNVDATVTGWWEGEMAPSPDGRSVAMWRVPNNGARQAITIYPADGSGPGRALGPSLRGTGQWAWAPDSSRLLVNYNDPSEGNQILVDPVTGESTNAPWAVNSQPDWQRLAP